MMVAQHTPGPWLVLPDDDIPGHREADRVKIGSRDYDVGSSANARLVAAAPDLLAALKLFRTKVYNAALCSGMDHEWATEACSLADAAIAKAEGGAA